MYYIKRKVEDMRDYIVEIVIEHGGYSLESEIEISAYSEEEARDGAIEKVMDNLLFCATNVEREEEDSEYNVTVSIEYGGYSLESDEYINAYSEEEAKDGAIEKVRNNYLLNANNVECEVED